VSGPGFSRRPRAGSSSASAHRRDAERIALLLNEHAGRRITGVDPTAGPYRPAFEAAGFVADYRALVLWTGYR
jgi:hypothetical protein